MKKSISTIHSETKSSYEYLSRSIENWHIIVGDMIKILTSEIKIKDPRIFETEDGLIEILNLFEQTPGQILLYKKTIVNEDDRKLITLTISCKDIFDEVLV